jgi:hypothetical protein
MKTGNGLSNIKIHPLIDCPEYRNLLKVLMGIKPKDRPIPVALKLPVMKYKYSQSAVMSG